jgi:hypothetical protein
MKKFIAIAAAAVALTGCSSYDHNECRNSVVKEVGTQDVVEIEPFRFVARDSKGAIWYYETMNQLDTRVSKKQPVFVAQN